MRSRRPGFTQGGQDDSVIDKVVFETNLPCGSYISIPGQSSISHLTINSKCSKCRDKPYSLVIRVLFCCLNPNSSGWGKLQLFCPISLGNIQTTFKKEAFLNPSWEQKYLFQHSPLTAIQFGFKEVGVSAQFLWRGVSSSPGFCGGLQKEALLPVGLSK